MKETNRALLAALVTMLLALFALAAPAHATTFTVNSTGDGQDMDTTDGQCLSGFMRTGSGLLVGECTLRAAIEQANATAGADTINFNISGTGVHTIKPASELPAITDTVTIDGYSQPGAKANTNGPGLGTNAVLRVELDGTNAENADGSPVSGLTIWADNSKVRGLVINRFPIDGIWIAASGVAIEGNFIGTNASGTKALGNRLGGISISGKYDDKSGGNLIGGTTPAARNLISGNDGDGVSIGNNASDPGTKVQGNLIGTDRSGTQELGNGVPSNNGSGVSIGGHGHLVGGTTAAARNIISGNGWSGVHIGASSGSSTSGNKVQGNFIGTDVTGTKDLGNDFSGVFLWAHPCGAVIDNIVGGSPSGRNVIAFNGGSFPYDRFPGVRVRADPCPVPGLRSSAYANAIVANSIFSNAGLGIDLGKDGAVTPNDPGDADTGPNVLQNFPVLTSVFRSGGTTTIKGELNTNPNAEVIIQFFSSPKADASGYGEGKTYLGQKTGLKADANGNVSFTFTTTKAFAGEVVTATASSLGGTSEFSKAVAVDTAPTITNVSPAPGSKTRDATPTIKATVSDSLTNLAKSHIKLYLDGKRITTFSYDRSKDRLSYTSRRLSLGTHTVRITARDAAGNVATRKWSFKVVR